eukprot:Seg1120.5 transcript_id=Seg1120.5/GoldUCD/mRNA.D3Y31 product="Adenosine 3'-phospho 5'-phosphosulfate transporter 2" protein_id=Seg1120.5/GoldUCD/D3Y31
MKEFVGIAIPSTINGSRNRNQCNGDDFATTRRPFQTSLDDDIVMNKNSNKGKFVALGIDLTSLPDAAKFMICCSGVFFFYLIYGYMQELIFRLPGFKPYGWYLTLVQFGCCSVFGMAERIVAREAIKRRIPLKTYGLLAFLTVATMGLSNTSVGYLNYPTQVIFKCCKLIPVMIGGIIIQGKQYTRLDFIACMCMSVGLIFFTLADSEVSPNFDHTGVILISLALCADAVIGNVQEKAMKFYDAPNTEVVLYSYSIGFVYILFGLLISGGFIDAFNFCLKHPMETYGYAVLFSFTGYLGISYVLTIVRMFGALLAVTDLKLIT